jgi:dTDP-4-dehydrorhamnose 3,5-epimerase
MKIVKVSTLGIPDIKVIQFARFPDQRGYFTEPFRKSDFENHPETSFLRGLEFVQANESYSHPGTIRGLHFQWNPWMGKLVRTLSGRMVDLVLDIRKGSPHSGKIVAYEMPSTTEQAYGEWIWVPPGFAHGNLFLEPTQIEYYCTGQYSPGCEASISPLAGDLDWSLCPLMRALFDRAKAGPLIISEKDKCGVTWKQWQEDARSENFVFGRC